MAVRASTLPRSAALRPLVCIEWRWVATTSHQSLTLSRLAVAKEFAKFGAPLPCAQQEQVLQLLTLSISHVYQQLVHAEASWVVCMQQVEQLRNCTLTAERALLYTMGFNFLIRHPQVHMLNVSKRYNLDQYSHLLQGVPPPPQVQRQSTLPRLGSVCALIKS